MGFKDLIQHPAPSNLGEPQSVRDACDRLVYGKEPEAEAEAEAM